MTAYYTGYFKMQNYEKSAIKRLTAPAYLFLSIDFGAQAEITVHGFPEKVLNLRYDNE